MIDGRVNEEDNIFTEDIAELFASKIGLTDEEQLKDLEEGLYEMTCNLNNPHEFEYRKTTYYVLSELAEVLKKERDKRFYESRIWEKVKPVVCIP